jgi:hypothetical protein
VSDAAGMEDLRKRDEMERGVVPPFYVAFGAADGKNEIGFVLMVARDEAIEARFGTAENEIGHVNPGDEFIRGRDVARLRLGL